MDSEAPSLLAGYVPIAAAAVELGVHPRTLKRWKSLRYGPKPVHIGKRLYYRRADVAEWLESLGQEPQPKRSRR